MHDGASSFLSDSPGAASDFDGALSRRYLVLLAEVAGQLLAGDAGEAMVVDLFELIRAELRLDVFFNYRLEDGVLVLEAHGGLTEAEAAAGARLAIGEAVCGCVARDRRPMHAMAVQWSDDPMVAFVRDIGLDAYACTPLLHGNDLIGTLGFGRRWADRFSEDEIHFLHTVCHYVGFAKQRRRREAELRAGVASRDRLLSELNHRVRNALQMATSLIQIDAGEAPEPAARAALLRAGERIQVLATAHRPLYASESADKLDVQVLLQQIVEQATGRAALVAASERFTMPVEQAVALGLVVDEIVAMAVAESSVAMRLARGTSAQGAASLRIEFDDIAPPGDRPSGGTRVLQALLRQLRAVIIPAGPGPLCLELPDPSRD